MEEKLNQLSFKNAAIFGLLLAAAYYFLFYQPSNPQNLLDRLDAELIEAKATISKLDRQIKEGQIIETEVNTMKKFVESTYSQLSEKITVSEATAAISQEARTVGLSIESITSSGQWNKKQTVAVVDVQASVVGTFSQVMIFLSELTRDNKVYSVSNLTVESKNKAQELEVNVKIQAYRKLALNEIKAKESSDDY